MEKALRREATPNVRFLGHVGDEGARSLYRESPALVFPGVEDFGIAMAEAQACGTPVIAVDAGGAKDIVVGAQTGWLLQRGSPAEVRRSVIKAAASSLDETRIRANALRFSRARFLAEFQEVVAEATSTGQPGS